jgi:hypothetical protein
LGGGFWNWQKRKPEHGGAKNAYLDTFSFQAPEFYKKCGHQEFGTLENFPTGHTRYFLTKKL